MGRVYRKGDSISADEISAVNEQITAISESPPDTVLQRKPPGKERRPSRHRKLKIFIIIIVVLAAVFAACFLWFRHMLDKGRENLLSNPAVLDEYQSVVASDGSSVDYDGSFYRRNENVVSFLLMGIDDIDGTKGDGGVSKGPGTMGQADTIFYGTLDLSNGRLRLLNISRDSITDVDLYDEDGGFVRTEPMQICLAYAYGSDDKSCCENVVKSARKLLFNAPVDFYAAIDFPAISVLTDSIGGVRLEVLEDLSAKDSALKKGAVVALDGSQAMAYVRSRDFGSLDSNNARMRRQEQFVRALLTKLRDIVGKRPYALVSLYQTLSEYVTSDIALEEALFLSEYALRQEVTADTVQTVKGTVSQDGELARYDVDKDSLYGQLLDMLYVREGGSDIVPQETESETEDTQDSSMAEPVDFSKLY